LYAYQPHTTISQHPGKEKCNDNFLLRESGTLAGFPTRIRPAEALRVPIEKWGMAWCLKNPLVTSYSRLQNHPVK